MGLVSASAIGEELYEMRTAAGVSREELCLEIGYEKGVYHLHESGKREYSSEARSKVFYNEVMNGIEIIVQRRK